MTRQNAQILRDVIEAMQSDPGVSADRIWAEICKGVVSLHGDVEWTWQRTAAEHCVGRVEGVLGIDNRITAKSALSNLRYLPEPGQLRAFRKLHRVSEPRTRRQA